MDDRSRFLVTDPSSIAAQMQQQQAMAMQQQQMQQQMLAQQMMMGGGAAGMGLGLGLGGVASAAAAVAASTQAATVDRKQREIYIGNLAIGLIGGDLLREFFDAVFAHWVPDAATNPPVTNVTMDPTGRFAFVEFRTQEMATKAIEMDKLVGVDGGWVWMGGGSGWGGWSGWLPARV